MLDISSKNMIFKKVKKICKKVLTLYKNFVIIDEQSVDCKGNSK